MRKFITLLIGCSLALAAGVQAKPDDQQNQQNAKNKKSKPVQKQQFAPKQNMAPKSNVHPMPQQHINPTVHTNPTVHNNPTVHKDNARTYHPNLTKQQIDTFPKVEPNAKVHNPNQIRVNPNHPVVQPNTSVVNQNNFNNNKTVHNYQPRHQNFHASVNSSVASAQFNQNYRIRNANNWHGAHYNVFRTYHPQWHDRSWWHSHHNNIVLIGGGWYYWNSGYWYPAWGYDTSAAYYPYDGPIYVGSSPRPFDQVVADVQSVLQEQGYYHGEVDGLVGPLTQEALASYQSSQGLEPTAAVDQPTLESLGIS